MDAPPGDASSMLRARRSGRGGTSRDTWGFQSKRPPDAGLRIQRKKTPDNRGFSAETEGFELPLRDISQPTLAVYAHDPATVELSSAALDVWDPPQLFSNSSHCGTGRDDQPCPHRVRRSSAGARQVLQGARFEVRLERTPTA